VETRKQSDEVNSCIDVILNIGGFMYIGIVLPWDDFKIVGYPRLFALAVLVLIFRRIPALLITYKAMPGVVTTWKEAVFMGYFGPIGVGAVYYLEHTRHLFFQPERTDEEAERMLAALGPGTLILAERGI
jgi:sodium/hydrogen antiporter